MKLTKHIVTLLALLAGGMPLATFATCNRTDAAGSFRLVSSNDDLVRDVLDIVFDHING